MCRILEYTLCVYWNCMGCKLGRILGVVYEGRILENAVKMQVYGGRILEYTGVVYWGVYTMERLTILTFDF